MKIIYLKLKKSILGLLLPILSGLSILITMVIGCDSIQQTTYIGVIQGWIYNDSTMIPLTGVKITSSEFNQVVYSGDTGVFIIKKISMGTSEHSYPLKFQFYGYKDTIINLICRSDEITKYYGIMMHDTL